MRASKNYHLPTLLDGLHYADQYRLLLNTPLQEQDADALSASLQARLAGFNESRLREDFLTLFRRVLPLSSLVPDCYRPWTPVVDSCFEYLILHLSLERLLPRIIELLQLPEDTDIAGRLLVFMRRMPALQKCGQILARDPELDSGLREKLVTLENGIRDVDGAVIRNLLHEHLKGCAAGADIQLDEGLIAEATVSAVIGFTYIRNKGSLPQRGVFKVIKPHIPACFDEDLRMLGGLAQAMRRRADLEVLGSADLPGLFEDVRDLLRHEVDLRQEQTHLAAVTQRYARNPVVRVPEALQEFCSDRITAMTELNGVKVTEAWRKQPIKRVKLSRWIINTLLIEPMLDENEDSLLHGDPHAGNLMVDEEQERLCILDWAMVEQLPREDRRYCLLLLSGVYLRDRALLAGCIQAVSNAQDSQHQLIEELVDKHLATIPWYRLPGVDDFIHLLDEGFTAGLRYRRSLTVFRKILITLEGVLHDISPQTSLDLGCINYLLTQMMSHTLGLGQGLAGTGKIQIPLRQSDAMTLILSAQSWWPRQYLSWLHSLGAGPHQGK